MESEQSMEECRRPGAAPDGARDQWRSGGLGALLPGARGLLVVLAERAMHGAV
jgi:hypothetical protein